MSKKIFLFISVSILSAAFLFSLNSVAIKAQNFSENQDKQYVPPVVSHKESESGLNFYLYPSEAVSYTHLDVYKRQPSASTACAIEAISVTFGESFTIIGFFAYLRTSFTT